MNLHSIPVRFVIPFIAWCSLVGVDAQLLNNLETFGNSVSLIDQSWNDPGNLEMDGPKELATADFDGDNQADLAASKVFGKVSIVFGKGGKDFTDVQFLVPPPETGELRGISTADFNGDGFSDIAVAAPYSGRVIIFHSLGNRNFGPPITVEAWRGVRNLLALDLDGDGNQDLIAAGPKNEEDSLTSRAAVARLLINLGEEFALREEVILNGGDWEDQFPRPVFSMSRLPALSAGQGARAVLTHANSNSVWILLLDQDGVLAIDQNIPSLLPTRALAAGPVVSRDGAFDLIQAARDENQILVRNGDGSGGFNESVSQRLYIPGSPRALQLADVDADGWKDLLVVLRNYDRVVTFHNDQGVFSLVAEAPVGSSPRDLAAADFNGDGRLDLAVANRRSDDISVLLTQPDSSGFERFDSVYDVDGGVSGLVLHDMNSDGRDDIIQSHVLTSEISVRLAGQNGVLSSPLYTMLEARPVSFRAGDFNADGNSDLIVVHSESSRPGFSALLGNGDGTFESPIFVASQSGRLFSVILSDFDGDGIQDAAVGNYDCRLSMYQGQPNGEFKLVRTGRFAYEARAMIAGDFDQDGDLDLAGASATGSISIVNNDGRLLTLPAPGEPIYQLLTFDSPVGKSRIKSMVVIDWNGDEDDDLAINSEDGVSVFIGGDGLEFEAHSSVLPGTRGASDLVLGDFDGDGTDDLASACRLLSCVVILKGSTGGGAYELASVNPVPAADHIATGDIDGDGLADLAGSGEVLWVALSSRAPLSASGSIDTSRPPIDSVVINEFLASNKSYDFLGNGETPDALELFNGRDIPVSLAGWQLVYQGWYGNGELEPARYYQFPATALMEPRSHLVLYCDSRGGEFHTAFKLARDGATLTLKAPDGTQIDSVSYGLQEPDASYGRYTDGAQLTEVKETPDIGSPNFSNTNHIEPDIKKVSIDPQSLIDPSGNVQPLILVKAEDKVGIFTLNAIWQTMDGQHSGRTGLYDDGMHGDRGMLDGWFGATLPTLPAGSKVEFFLQASNLIDEDETSPGDPVFSLPGLEITNYAFTIPDSHEPQLAIEISEIQPSRNGVDANGDRVDYIEIRNTGTSAISLEELALRDSLFAAAKSHSLGGELAPGDYRVYFANNTPNAGPDHMSFKLDSEGDTVWLVSLDDRGIVSPIDRVQPATGKEKNSWARLGPGGEFFFLPPSQGKSNIAAHHIFSEYLPTTGVADDAIFRIGFASPLNKTSTVEFLKNGAGVSWIPLQSFQGTGHEEKMDLPFEDRSRIFRVRRN